MGLVLLTRCAFPPESGAAQISAPVVAGEPPGGVPAPGVKPEANNFVFVGVMTCVICRVWCVRRS